MTNVTIKMTYHYFGFGKYNVFCSIALSWDLNVFWNITHLGISIMLKSQR